MGYYVFNITNLVATMNDELILDGNLTLDVDFRDKDKVKRAGAKPQFVDGKFVGWFVPKGKDVAPFKAWWPADFRQQMGVEEEQADVAGQSMSLTELLTKVKGTLERYQSGAEWVRAEVVNIGGAHHLYLELSDYDIEGNEQAKTRGVIWASQRSILKRFESETGIPLKSGVKILCKAYVEFSERYGFSLRIIDIDTKFTLGDMEAKLLQIRNTLTREGVIDKNRRLRDPGDFTNVAVIAPDGAAGLGDFMTLANSLMDYGLCDFKHYPATFQGQNATRSLCAALDSVLHAVEAGVNYDAVVIIRGGGDKAGLYALNELEIARRVCLMPVPVMVGIGHERDDTILDELARVRCATPSLVISGIAGQIMHNAKQAREDFMRIKSMTKETLSRARLDCHRMESVLASAAQGQLQFAAKTADRLHQQVIDETRHALSRAKNQVRELMTSALYSDPRAMISKGYALVRDESGKVVGDGASLTGIISVQMRDGQIKARIEG